MSTHNTREVEGLKEFYSTEGIPEEMKQAISFMRQWLNEDRKATPMVTARDLWHWIGPSLHHQLQKARQYWLREEIVRLKVMMRDQGGTPHKVYSKEDTIFNSALQTIIDRYHSELDQDTETVTMTVGNINTSRQEQVAVVKGGGGYRPR